MKNKVLVSIVVPETGVKYDAFIPVNEVVWKVTKMLAKCVSDLSGGSLDLKKDYLLLNMNSGSIYPNNALIFDTDIRNATELVLFSVKNN